MEIANYVRDGGTKISPERAEAFRQQLPVLRLKAASIEAREVPHLPAQIEFLAQTLEDVLDGKCRHLPFAAIGETVFALGYALKGNDIIPDSFPGLGLQDDSSVIRAVLTRYEDSFRALAAERGVAWATISAGA